MTNESPGLFMRFIDWMRYLGMVILSGATLAGFILIFFDLAQYLFHSSDFTVEEVSIVNNNWLEEQEIRARASIAPGSNIWMLDLDHIRANLLEHPIIRDVQVQRIPPRRIHLVIHERAPVVYILNHTNGNMYGVGQDGVMLPPYCPIVSGIKSVRFEPGYQIEDPSMHITLEFLNHLKKYAPDFYQEVSEARWRENGDLVLHPRRRMGVLVLREEFDASVAQKIGSLWNLLEEKNLRVIYVDARFPNKGVAVRWDESEGQKWKKLYKNGETALTHAM